MTQQLKASAKGHNPCSDKYDQEKMVTYFPLYTSLDLHLNTCYPVKQRTPFSSRYSPKALLVPGSPSMCKQTLPTSQTGELLGPHPALQAKIASQGMPQTAGRKHSTHGRSDKWPRHSPQHQRCTEEFSFCMPVAHHGISADETDKYKFNCLRGTLVYVCYGCGQWMWYGPSSSFQRGPVLKRAKDVKEAFSEVNILNNSPATQYLTRFNNCQHFWLSNTRHLHTQT